MCMMHYCELELELGLLVLTDCTVVAIVVQQQGLCQLDTTALAGAEVAAS